jgi:hypothetical protein
LKKMWQSSMSLSAEYGKYTQILISILLLAVEEVAQFYYFSGY